MTGRQEAEEAAKENTGSYNFATAGSHAAAGFTWTIAGQAADRVPPNLSAISGFQTTPRGKRKLSGDVALEELLHSLHLCSILAVFIPRLSHQKPGLA